MGGMETVWVGSICSPKDGIGYTVSGTKEEVLTHYQEHFPFLLVEDITSFIERVWKGKGWEWR